MSQLDLNQENPNQKTTPVIFQGKASEYFGIWIVNLLLSLITLGIYSAWAKVRRKKYFYNNTLIENVGFDYHAKPISILKGRIIAVAFFVGYSMSASINPLLPGVFLIIFFLVLPWLVVRGSLFNARNTSYRGLRFDFIGTIGQAVKVFIGLPLLILPTLGLIMPYVAHQKSQFMVNNHRFGLSQFTMQPVIKKYYKVYFIVMVLPVLIAIIGILAAIAIPAYQGYLKKAKEAPHAELAMPAGVVAFATVNQAPKLMLAANEVPEEMQKVERVFSEANPPETSPPADTPVNPSANTPVNSEVLPPVSEDELKIIEEEMAKQQKQKELQTEAIEQGQKAVQVEKTPEEIMQEEQQKQKDEMREMMKNPAMMIGILIGSLVYILFIFAFVGYIQARIGNLIWNNTMLDKLSFRSTLRARDFIWLYFTNIIAIICTFGLATPWAQIRMAKYRASKLQIVGDVDFDQFVGDKKAEVNATGEEIADFFDVDLSFG
jgi:uncharacterized membrane protein YjgN (DUF898 family)